MNALPGEFESLEVRIDEGLLRITLDRPQAGNSRNQTMREELSHVYGWIERNEAARCVVLTGSGERFFCAGMDLKEAGLPEPQLERRQRLRAARDLERLAALPVPTIAAINGFALGGGLEMALACDFRLAAAHAELGLPEIHHGLIPGGGGTQRLPRLIGYAHAISLILLGQRVTAEEAARINLVNRVLPGNELLEAAETLGRQLCSLPSAAVRAAKEACRKSLELPLSAGLDMELDSLLFLMYDRREEGNAE